MTGMIAQRVAKMWLAGRTVTEIAADLGMTRYKIRRIVAEIEIPPVEPDEQYEPRLLPHDEDTAYPWADDENVFDRLGNRFEDAPPDEILAELAGFFAEEDAA